MKNQLNNQYFENLFNYSNLPVICWDRAFKIIRYNKAFEKLTGRKVDFVIGKSIEILFPESTLAATMQLIRIAESGSCLEDTEIDILPMNGIVRTVIWNSSIILDVDNRTPIYTIALCQDITEHKRIEKELSHLNHQKELILGSVEEGVLGLDLKGNHTFVNPAAAKMLGYNPEELIGLPSHSIWHHTKADGNFYPEEECPIYLAFKDGKVHHATNDVFWKKDGTSFSVEFASNPILEDEQLTGSVVTFTDITEQKSAEEALRKSEQQMKAFVHDSLLCIYFFNPQTRKIIYANPSFFQLLGYLPEDIETLTIYDFLNHPKESVDSFVNHVLQTKQRNVGERQWKRKDGKVIDMLVNASHGDNTDSNIVYISAQDISERKHAERELQKSEHFLNESQKVSKIGSYVLDISIGKWKGSEQLDSMFGISVNDDHSLENWISIIHPEHKKMMTDYFELEVLGKKKRFDKEYKIINQKTKEIFWVNGIGELEFDCNNVPVKMLGTIQNITERKKSEQILLENKERLKRGEMIAKFGNWELVLDNNIVYSTSAGSRKIYGTDKNESSLDDVKKFVLPEYRQKMDEALNALIFEGKSYDIEFKIKRANDGKIVDIHSIAEYNPETRKIFGVVQDITERKQAQQEITESEKKFKSVLQSAKDSIVLANEKGIIIFWNHFAEKTFGYGEHEVLGKPLSFIMPEQHRAAHLQGFAQHSSTNLEPSMANTIELHGLKKNRKEFPIELSLSHWTNENGKFYCGIIRDITERKNAEDEQKKHVKKLSEIAFLQAHIVRAPIASILGLIDLINFEKPDDPQNLDVIQLLKKTSLMCDKVIREVILKTTEIEEINKKF